MYTRREVNCDIIKYNNLNAQSHPNIILLNVSICYENHLEIL